MWEEYWKNNNEHKFVGLNTSLQNHWKHYVNNLKHVFFMISKNPLSHSLDIWNLYMLLDLADFKICALNHFSEKKKKLLESKLPRYTIIFFSKRGQSIRENFRKVFFFKLTCGWRYRERVSIAINSMYFLQKKKCKMFWVEANLIQANSVRCALGAYFIQGFIMDLSELQFSMIKIL